MKKVMFGLMIGILMISFASFTVIAANGEQVRSRIDAGDYQVGGDQLRIQEKENNRIQLRVNGVDADCDCKYLTDEFDPVQNRTRLNFQLSNGRNAEIKIMPDTASETALARLRLRVCNESNNCSIELKEVGNGEGNQTKAAYEMQIQRHEKLLGLFRIKAQNRIQIDAENGEVIQVKRPWWSFLATDVEE